MTNFGCGRFTINGRIKVKTPLRIRTGESRLVKIKAANEEGRQEETSEIALVFTTKSGAPLIPGSSLKGVLLANAWKTGWLNNDNSSVASRKYRHLPNCLQRMWKILSAIWRRGTRIDNSRVIAEAVFGAAPKDEERLKAPLGGKVIFCDAVAQAPDTDEVSAVTCRGQTAIDPLTRAAMPGFLRQGEFVPEGTEFPVKIIADDLSEDELGCLLDCLRLLDGSSLGGGTAHGDGSVEWCPELIEHIDAEAVLEWLTDAKSKRWDAIEARNITEVSSALGKVNEARVKTNDWARVNVSLQFDGAFLVSKRPTNKRGEPREKSEGETNLSPLRSHNGRGFLPGTSVKGALRAQASRILTTLSGESLSADTPKARQMREIIYRLFGNEEHRARLEFSHFYTHSAQSPETQEFVAIDRFTGGSAKRKKFNIEFLSSPILIGEIALDRSDDSVSDDSVGESDIGLLALLARDLKEGDIRFGFGSGKGYGVLRCATIKPLTEQAQVKSGFFDISNLDESERTQLQECVRKLHDLIVDE